MKTLLTLLAVLIGSWGFTQVDSSKILDESALFASLDLGSNGSNHAVSLAAHQDWHFGKRRRLVVGSGLRFQTFFGQDVIFTSAPPEFAADPAKQDSLLAPAPFIYSLNAMISLGYHVTPRLFLGFNIDAFGVSFGPHGSPEFVSNGVSQTAEVRPTPINILLVGANDIGSLKAQFYGRYKFSDQWGVQAGLQNLFNELTTKAVLQTSPKLNDRFRAMSSHVFLGMSYHF